jgi:hypothetical protein
MLKMLSLRVKELSAERTGVLQEARTCYNTLEQTLEQLEAQVLVGG